MTRVLVVGRGEPERGGIPTFLAQIGQGVGEHEIVLLNLARPEVREGGRFSCRNLTGTIHDLWRLWRAAAETEVTHIHSALLATPTIVRAGALAVVARARGNRVVVHAHGGKLLDWITPRRRAVVRLAMAPANIVIGVSARVTDLLGGILGPRVTFVPNGVETTIFTPAERSATPRPTVLFVGGLAPRKGVQDLLEASRAARAKGAEHALVLVGGEPDEGGDVAGLRAAAAAGELELRGALPREELPAVYRDAAIFCLPSWWEAAPMSVLEAMSSALPVVASAVGDVPAMVEDGVTGRLVPPRDVDALTAALVELINGPQLRSAWGEAARRRVTESWSIEATRAALDDIYRRLGGDRS